MPTPSPEAVAAEPGAATPPPEPISEAQEPTSEASPTAPPPPEPVAPLGLAEYDPTVQIATQPAARSIVAGRISPSLGLGGYWKVLRYRDLISQVAEATGADPAIMAALMDVEGSGENAVSPAGARGLMQLMPDKFQPGDDPFDPPTNLLRAAQLIRKLQDRWQDPDRVAAAYFGAIDGAGTITGASDGNVNGFEYVARFRRAFQLYGGGLLDLPNWLVSPLGETQLTSEMIAFGYYGDYGVDLARAIRGGRGVELLGTLHLGLDLHLPNLPQGGRGTPVVAPFDGRIVRTSDHAGGPYGIWLESEKLNLRARLMHMDGLVRGIETGVEVKAGQQLGVLGGQGTEEFPHLHLAFERLSDGDRFNPALVYRLKDPTDPSTWVGSWLVAAPGPWSVPGQLNLDAHLIPDGHGGHEAHRSARLLSSRWGPFDTHLP